jgi:hypothetical protein
MFKVFDCDGVYQVRCLDDLIYLIKNLITSLLVECLLVVQV